MILPDSVELARADSGERLWPFPLDADFAKPLKSDVADTLQCTVASEADHIFAAKFLQRFVAKDVPWLHIDIAGPAKTDNLGHVRAKHEATGFGVRAVVWAIFCELRLPRSRSHAAKSPSA